MNLEEAISQLIDLGEKDPIELARTLGKRYDDKWLAAELLAHSETIVAEMARQLLGSRRRSLTLPAVLKASATKRDVMLAAIFIPGEGWKALGDCTAEDLASREQFYLRAASSMVAWASWCRACIEAMREQGVAELSKLKGELPELPEAEAA